MSAQENPINPVLDYQKIVEVYNNIKWINVSYYEKTDRQPYTFYGGYEVELFYWFGGDGVDDGLTKICTDSIKIDDFEDYILISITYFKLCRDSYELESDIRYTWFSYKIDKSYTDPEGLCHYFQDKDGRYSVLASEDHEIYDFNLYNHGVYQYIPRPTRFKKTKSARN